LCLKEPKKKQENIIRAAAAAKTIAVSETTTFIEKRQWASEPLHDRYHIHSVEFLRQDEIHGSCTVT
jgi:hypothetical protein